MPKTIDILVHLYYSICSQSITLHDARDYTRKRGIDKLSNGKGDQGKNLEDGQGAGEQEQKTNPEIELKQTDESAATEAVVAGGPETQVEAPKDQVADGGGPVEEVLSEEAVGPKKRAKESVPPIKLTEPDHRGRVPSDEVLLRLARKINTSAVGRLSDEDKHALLNELSSQCASRIGDTMPDDIVQELCPALLDAVMAILPMGILYSGGVITFVVNRKRRAWLKGYVEAMGWKLYEHHCGSPGCEGTLTMGDAETVAGLEERIAKMREESEGGFPDFSLVGPFIPVDMLKGIFGEGFFKGPENKK